MSKITFMGAGSSIFVKNVMGDAMMTPSLRDFEICLYDIDAKRLRESKAMLDILNDNVAIAGVIHRPVQYVLPMDDAPRL